MFKAAKHEFETAEEALEFYYDQGWTDGMPVVPPTVEKVQPFLEVVGLKPETVLGTVPTREVTVTAEQMAINAVMAGCKPEYMPVVLAAVRALMEEKANFHSTTGTLSGAAQVLIINGPIRKELGVACKDGCFGPGFRPNATIGRALRLLIRNVGRSIPGVLDRATYSTPARYSFCFGENEEDSPWEPLHVERGFAPTSSAVTLHASFYQAPSRDSVSREPKGILDSYARTIRQYGVSGDAWIGENANLVVVIGMEHMRYFAEAKWTKQQMREYLFPKVKAPPEKGEFRVSLGKPEGILFVAAGGHGMNDSWMLFPHLAWAITKPVG